MFATGTPTSSCTRDGAVGQGGYLPGSAFRQHRNNAVRSTIASARISTHRCLTKPTVFKTRQVFPEQTHVRQEPLSENPVSVIIISHLLSAGVSETSRGGHIGVLLWQEDTGNHRPARGRRSQRRESHAQFCGEGVVTIPPPYPTSYLNGLQLHRQR
jgi:hypothetical protein